MLKPDISIPDASDILKNGVFTVGLVNNTPPLKAPAPTILTGLLPVIPLNLYVPDGNVISPPSAGKASYAA